MPAVSRKVYFLFLQLIFIFILNGSLAASSAETVAEILDLSEDEFFSNDQSFLVQREERLLDVDFSGIAVNAPQRILTHRHDKLPLIMAVCSSGERDWAVNLVDNCFLVGMNLQDGSVHLVNPFVNEKELRSRNKEKSQPKCPKPPGLALETVQLTELDARDLLHMKWNTGNWSFGVIYYDWPSNTVEVELKGVKKRKPLSAGPISPEPDFSCSGALPGFLATPRTPPSPVSGVDVSVEACVERGRQRLFVFGAFTVPVRAFHLPSQGLVHKFQNGREENVAAVIPVTMAVIGLDWDESLQFDWAVPVYSEALKVGMPARGCFAIDALEGGNAKDFVPGKYLCYIIMDGRIFGPQAFSYLKKDLRVSH